MLECFKASTYKTADFQFFLRHYSENIACVLCGQIHLIRFHGYVERKIRDSTTYANIEIKICVIICHFAQAAGRQYTKRMLPPFIIPECNITLENDFRMYQAMPDGKIEYDHAAPLLGTYYAETIKRHYAMIAEYAQVCIGLLASYLSLYAAFMDLPGKPPYEEGLELLVGLSQAVYEGECKRSGSSRVQPPLILYLHPVYVMRKSRIPLQQLQKPSNLYSCIRWYFDTS